MGAQTSHSSYPPEAEQEDKITNSPSKADSSPLKPTNLKRKLDAATIVDSPSDQTNLSPLRPRMIETKADTPSGDRGKERYRRGVVGEMTQKYMDSRGAADTKRRLQKKNTPILKWLGGTKKKSKTTKLRL